MGRGMFHIAKMEPFLCPYFCSGHHGGSQGAQKFAFKVDAGSSFSNGAGNIDPNQLSVPLA